MQPPQTPQKLPPRAPSPQSFGGGAAFSPTQGIGASQASVAAAAAAAAVRARAAEQMAYEDAWKASNPDFKTPFASVEDAVSRLLPYHVFADYEEDDDVCEGDTEKSSDEKWDQQVIEAMSSQISEFEKQVLAFNVMAGKRADGTMCGEEKFMLDLMLQNDERRMTEHLRAALIAQQEKQQQEEEAARAAAARLALAQAQAGGSGPWTLVQQPTASPWQQALAAAALGPGGAQMPPQQQLDAAAAANMWMMMQQQQQHQQQQQQQQHQQQQYHQQQQQQLALGVWPTFVAARGEGSSSSSGQAGVPGVWQGQGQGQGQAAVGQAMSGAPAAGMAQTWWASDAQQREQ